MSERNIWYIIQLERGENEKYRNEWQEDGRLIPFFRIKALPHPEIEWGRAYALQRQEWL